LAAVKGHLSFLLEAEKKPPEIVQSAKSPSSNTSAPPFPRLVVGVIIQPTNMDLASSPPPLLPKRRRVSEDPYEPRNDEKNFKSPEEELKWLRQDHARLILLVEGMKRLLGM